MHICHSSEIWRDFPELVPGVVLADGITKDVSVGSRIANFNTVAEGRLSASLESELPEIQAWRRVFSRMGLKPTNYRCASEALLRRFRKEKSLPRIHPLIDLCNSISMAFAIPIAVFDVSTIAEHLEVRHADGTENYLTFTGEIEHPVPREIIFADTSGRAHARRWTNRQSAYSAVRQETSSVLIVAEAMHESAESDVQRLLDTVSEEIGVLWSSSPTARLLNPSSSLFEF